MTVAPKNADSVGLNHFGFYNFVHDVYKSEKKFISTSGSIKIKIVFVHFVVLSSVTAWVGLW